MPNGKAKLLRRSNNRFHPGIIFLVKKRFTYRSFLALFLVALVLQAVVLKEVHHLREHNHEAVAHCITNGSETHIHSEAYAPVDCFLCFFHFAPATLSLAGFSIQAPVFTLVKNQFFYQNPLAFRVKWHFQLRGPPAVTF